MSLTKATAKHLRDVYFGGNWTSVNIQQTLSDIDWKEATKELKNYNSIATITFHMGYYIDVLIHVLKGEMINAKDEFSFITPEIHNQAEWDNLVAAQLEQAKLASALIEAIDEKQLLAFFMDEKYGTYYRNIHGIIEHLHYHLGQITVLKKLIQQSDD